MAATPVREEQSTEISFVSYKPVSPLQCIISDGSPGPNISALYTAKTLGLSTSGKCGYGALGAMDSFGLEVLPRKRISTEDAPPPPKGKAKRRGETNAQLFMRRSMMNIQSADATLIINNTETTELNRCTLNAAGYAAHKKWETLPEHTEKKDYYSLDAKKKVFVVNRMCKKTARAVRRFISSNKIESLCVIGSFDIPPNRKTISFLRDSFSTP